MPIHHCTQCGNKVTLQAVILGDPERYVCTSCGKVHYENPIPTAGALIVEDGKILLVRRAADPYRGEWDVPGGFLEKHEHPVEALVRELREELDVEVRVGELVATVMGTYDRDMSTMNMYYRAAIASGTPSPRSDIDKAEWFPLDDLPEIAFSQNREAIEMLKKFH